MGPKFSKKGFLQMNHTIDECIIQKVTKKFRKFFSDGHFFNLFFKKKHKV